MTRRVGQRATGRVVLLTGFEPFPGVDANPSAAIAQALDGRMIAGARIVGRVMPVAIDNIAGALDRALDEAGRPVLVVHLGVAAGEPTIRLERIAHNLADFEVPDNAGTQTRDRPLDPAGPEALAARLPLRAIQQRLLAAGIPARLSSSAGTYLCNALMYLSLARVPTRVACGFVHLPQTPDAVARLIAARGGNAAEPGLAAHASMALSTMRRAVTIALETALGAAPAPRRRRAAPRP